MSSRVSRLSVLWAIGLLDAGFGATVPEMAQRYCVDCHDGENKRGELNLDAILQDPVEKHPDTWERVVRQLQARQMPPLGKDRPDEAGFRDAVAGLTASLDAFAVSHPQPGRTETLRRLNRTEYQNAIRDLLSVEIDARTWLP